MSRRMQSLVDPVGRAQGESVAATAFSDGGDGHTAEGVRHVFGFPDTSLGGRDDGEASAVMSTGDAVDDAVYLALASHLVPPAHMQAPVFAFSQGPMAVAAPTLSVADMVVGEGDGYIDVVVSLSAPSASNVSVAYATAAATAAANYDFTGASGTLNFAAGETTKTVRIELEGSASYDSGMLEHFRFNLSAPTNATLAKASAMVSIVDNDTALAVGEQPGLFVRDVVVDEKAGTASFVVLLGGVGGVANASDVTVNYAVAGGNATSGSDYNGTADPLSEKLTFAAGEVVKTVTVAIADDATAEGAERFYLNLNNAVNARIIDGQGVATIGKSDGPVSTAPTLSVADMVVGEGDGYIDVVVSLSAPSASNVSVAYATAAATAAANYDFTGANGTLNFAAGETTKTVRIELEGSASYDSGMLEHFRFNLSAPTNATLAKASAMVSIVDNDTALAVGEQPGLFVRDVVVDEKAGTASFVVLLGGVGGVANASDVTVNYAVAGGNATSGSDYNGTADPLSGKLTFAAGEVVKTVTVAIADDATAEGAERFYLNLNNAVNARIIDGQGVATIGKSDGPVSTAPTLSVADMVVGEGDGYIDVVVSLSAPSASNVSVAYATAAATAAANYDFTGANGTLNFAAGETTKTVRIELEGSASYDSGMLEHFRFNLSAPTNATLAKASAMVSIVDNDTALAVGEQPGLFVRDVVVDEKAGTASFVVLLGGVGGVANASDVTVNYAVAGGNATSGSDYNGTADPLSEKLTFAAGEVVKTVTVAIADDATAEGAERFYLNLNNAVNARIIDGQGVATIGKSDGPVSTAPTLSVADMVVGEGDGYIDVVVSLSAPSASNVSVAYATAAATAAANYDFTGASGTLNFAAGETTKTVRIELEGSASYDSGMLEHFRFNLSAPTNATLAKASAMVSIVDNDTALAVGEQPGLFVRDVVVDEKAGTASFVVLLGGVGGVANASDVTVNYAVAGGNATSGSDYNGTADPLSGKLTFAAGEVVKTVTVAIADDATAEGAERINLSLSKAVNAAIVDGNGVAVVGANDGAVAAAPALSVASKTVSEGDGYVDMVVSLSGRTASNVSVNYATAAGTAAANYDFAAVSGTLNFAAGETTKTVRIELEQSPSYDTAGVQESFNLRLSAPVNATIATPAATITIIDDDLVGQKVFSYGISDDVYTINSATDVIVENVDGGKDLINSSISYTLGPNLENLTLVGAAIKGTGNALDNVLIGNAKANTLSGLAGNDILDGKAGADAMSGGSGNDTYIVDNVGDKVTEAANGGIDLVKSSISYVLGANLEKLTLTGSGSINGTGNALANTLTGNSGNNVLDGKAGADAMSGGSGNDTYIVDNVGDKVTEAANGGIDLVKSSISYVLGANLEKLTLTGSGSINGTGNALANTLTGNSGNNVLDGKAGADAMSGGSGNDTYIVDNVGDKVTEAANGGIDLVKSSISYVLGANLEKLTLTGSGSINGTGNALANTLTGNSGNNVLDGKAGADAMSGGSGNDTYIVDNVGDKVTEAANGGIDLVKSSISYVLGANLEKLTLTGSSAIAGTGNGLANTIAGNAAANTLTGGGGGDVFVLNSMLASDTITDFTSGSDKLLVSMTGIRIGDGDAVVDGAVTRSAAGGFATSAEFVVMKANIVGHIDATSAAAALGSATSAYAVGQTALFMVDNASDSALYYFEAHDANAIVDASELALLVSLVGAAQTTASDLVFGA